MIELQQCEEGLLGVFEVHDQRQKCLRYVWIVMYELCSFSREDEMCLAFELLQSKRKSFRRVAKMVVKV